MTGAVAGGHIPLVLLPGTLCDAELWQHQTQHLADIAAASIGDAGRGESIAGMAERVLEAAPSRFALAGLSMGGIVAFEILRRAPERVIGLALLSTNPSLPDDNQIAVWHEEIEMAESGHFEDFVEERWIPSVLEAGGSRGVTFAIPNARLAIIEDCGHLSTLEQPEVVTAILRDWLEGMIDCPMAESPGEASSAPFLVEQHA